MVDAWPTDIAMEAAAPPEASCAVHQLEVVFIVATAGAIGIAFPNLGAVFSLTGGVCGSFLSYIFPGLFFFKARQGAMGRALGAAVFVLGIVLSIATTILVAGQKQGASPSP